MTLVPQMNRMTRNAHCTMRSWLMSVELADDPFDSEDGNSDDQIKNGKQQSKDGS